jgi:hypothetical protein
LDAREGFGRGLRLGGDGVDVDVRGRVEDEVRVGVTVRRDRADERWVGAVQVADEERA